MMKYEGVLNKFDMISERSIKYVCCYQLKVCTKTKLQ